MTGDRSRIRKPLERDSHTSIAFNNAVDYVWGRLSEIYMHHPNGAEACYLKAVLDLLISGDITAQEAINEVIGTTLDDMSSFN